MQKQSGTNTVKVADGVQSLLKDIAKGLPSDIQIEVVNDQSRFIRKSMEEVRFHLLLAGVLVSLTILLFIRDWRTTLIATMAIPTSIVPTFLFMSYMGFTLNNITMLALILAIGIVIDDAVVVHENIFRHMEEGGLDAMAAARKGTKEIALAVLATSLSLVVIFLPVAFMGGMVGRFFSSFGLTVAFAIMMSLFVSFTLTPMLCSRFLKLEPSHGGPAKSKSGFVYRAIDSVYGLSLRWALRYRVRRRAGLPRRDRLDRADRRNAGRRFRAARRPERVSSDDRHPRGLHPRAQPSGCSARSSRGWRSCPASRIALPSIGENNNAAGKGQGDVTRGSIHLTMTELEDRDFTQFDVMEQARAILKDYPDLRTAVSDVSAIQSKGQDSRIFQLLLSGPDLEQARPVFSDVVEAAAAKCPGWPTSTPRSRCASPRCKCRSTAIAPATWPFRWKRSPTRSTCWSAGSRSRDSPKAPSSTTSGCGPTSSFAATRRRSNC